MGKVTKDLQFSVLNNILSMNQRQEIDAVADNITILSVNTSNDKPGVMSKRNGIPLINTTRGAGGIKGLVEWTSGATTVNDLLRIRSWRGAAQVGKYNLDVLNTSNNLFTTIDNTQTTIGNIVSVNYLNRVYHISSSNYLAYETGGTLTTVTNNNIKATCLAVSQNTLFVGNVSTVNGVANDYQDRVYYSDFSSNLPSDNFYNSARGETISNSTNFFTVQAPVTGLFSFGATGLLYVFTRDACYSFDVRLLDNRIGPLKKFNIGLINKRAIVECNGMMIWMDFEGRIWAWSGNGLPQNISWELQDDENGEAIISQIDRTSLSVFCAGTVNNKIYFSLGPSITYKGKTITNPVLKGLIPQNGGSILWSVDDFPVQPSVFATVLLNNKKTLIFGSATTDDLYKVGFGLVDGTNTAINSYFWTKFLTFKMDLYDKRWQKVYIKYRPQPTAGTYLTIKWAVDGNTSYAALTSNGNGAIDMNYGYTGTDYLATLPVNLPTQCMGKSLSLEISNSSANQDFEVSAIGFEYYVEGYTMNVRT